MTRDFEYLPLRHVAVIKNSNVDKLSLPGESPVRLCNYVDVYRNDRITQSVAFMCATATHSEITSFRLRLGDVLITKDSEQWNDIGVPALVATEADDLVCGYHLSMLRPHPSKILGSYLAYALRVPEVAVQLHLAAKGVTRYGLSQQGIKSAQVPVPSLGEQELIVRYLDHAELRIAKAIAAKQRLIALLDEAFEHERDQLLFGTQAETKVGTGIDWLEDAPAGWENLRLKFVMREVVRKSKDGMETHLSMSQVHGLVPSARGGSKFLSLSYEGGKVCEEGEIVLNRLKAHLGVFAVSPCLGVVSPDYAVLKVGSEHDARYLCALLRSKRLRPELRRRVTGLVEGFWRLYTDSLLDIAVMLPPLEEQKVIVEALNAASQRLEVALAALRREIALLKEYRTRLISDVVTGKLDVRDEAAKLPEIDPMELATVSIGENGDNEEAVDGE